MGIFAPAPQKSGKYMSGKYRVGLKFGHFVNFLTKMSCPPKLSELLRLWIRDSVTTLNCLLLYMYSVLVYHRWTAVKHPCFEYLYFPDIAYVGAPCVCLVPRR